MADAIGALRELAAHTIADGMQIPAPRGMAEVIAEKAAAYDPARESLVLVPLLLDRTRPVKANISLDAGLLEAIDEEAKRRGLTRSAFLVSAALDKIEGAEADTAEASRADGCRASGFDEPASAGIAGTRKARRR